MDTKELMELAERTYEKLLFAIPSLADSIRVSSSPLDSDGGQRVLRDFGQMLQMLQMEKRLSSDDLMHLMNRFTQILDKYKMSRQTQESKLNRAIIDSSLPDMEPYFNKLDLNAVRNSAAIFKAARESCGTEGYGDCSANVQNELKFGTQIIVDQLKTSSISDVMFKYEDVIRTLLIPDSFPSVEIWIIGGSEFEDRLKEISVAEPMRESMKRPDRSLDPHQNLPVKWSKVIRGGGMASSNILFGTMAIYGVHLRTGIGPLEPNAWQAVMSIYTGIFDIYEGFAGK